MCFNKPRADCGLMPCCQTVSRAIHHQAQLDTTLSNYAHSYKQQITFINSVRSSTKHEQICFQSHWNMFNSNNINTIRLSDKWPDMNNHLYPSCLLKKIFDRTENWTSEVVAIVQTVMTYCIIGLLLPPVKKQAICGSERAHST